MKESSVASQLPLTIDTDFMLLTSNVMKESSNCLGVGFVLNRMTSNLTEKILKRILITITRFKICKSVLKMNYFPNFFKPVYSE